MRRPLAFICLLISLVCIAYTLMIKPFPDSYANIREGNICIEGTVVSKEVKNDKNVFYLRDVTDCDTGMSYSGVICYQSEGDFPALGSFVRVTGNAKVFSRSMNCGEFDMCKYYLSLGYEYAMYECKINASGEEYSYYREKLYDIRKRLEDVYDKIMNEEDASVIKAMVLGDKNDMDAELKSLYQKSGISHILAISGLHISIMGMFIYGILKKTHMPVKLCFIISSVIMFNYSLMTGMSCSTERAFIMFILMLGAMCILRSYDMLSALALAGTVIILSDRYIIYNSGFWLSFSAVFGVGVFSRALCIREKKSRMPRKIVKAINTFLTDFGVCLFTIPILLNAYYDYPLYSVFLNLIVIPLMSIVLGCAVISGVTGMISLSLGAIAAYPCHIILKIYEALCRLVSELPFSELTVGEVSPVRVVIFYFLMALIYFVYYFDKYYSGNLTGHYRVFMRREREHRVKRGMKKGALTSFIYRMYMLLIPFVGTKTYDKCRMLIKVISVFSALLILVPVRCGLKISMLYVGQGDGIIVRYNDTVYMIDGGSSDKSQLAKYTLIPYLKSQGISAIDCWFVSHPDADHCSGLLEMTESYEDTGIEIDNIILPDSATINEDAKEIISNAKMCNIPISYISRGNEVTCGPVNLQCIWPAKAYVCDDINEYSQVLLLTYEDFSMLFTGDATLRSESEYIPLPENVSDGVDILKAPHHGSNTSSGENMISAAKPEVVLISSGINNRYGHPHEEIVQRYQSHGITILNTQECGEIDIYVTGRRPVINIEMPTRGK